MDASLHMSELVSMTWEEYERFDCELVEREPAIDVPAGARALGCCNCRQGDRARHPEIGLVYCWNCPVNLRRRERGQRIII
jgi:hypothetical protein